MCTVTTRKDTDHSRIIAKQAPPPSRYITNNGVAHGVDNQISGVAMTTKPLFWTRPCSLSVVVPVTVILTWKCCCFSFLFGGNVAARHDVCRVELCTSMTFSLRKLIFLAGKIHPKLFFFGKWPVRLKE